MGGLNFVAQADVGNDDGGLAINADIKRPSTISACAVRRKYFKMMRPVFLTNAQFSPLIDLSVDFSNVVPSSSPSFTSGNVTPWDTTPWDAVPWGGSQTVQTDWESIDGIGYAATYRMRTQTKGMQYSIQSVDFMFEPKRTPSL
ncbi:hypothetical protein AB1286_33190 [Trinickia sp. NRRL B-1857]|uniref:hypothetical protein n=1 Tax=Trinickia sp. NRRL B-1857 TaxID=3162879 RepID=UPI003D2DAB43